MKIIFPIKLGENYVSTDVKTHIERQENVASFSLPFKMTVNIENGKCVKVEKHESGFIYAVEFENINDAMDFEEKKECKVLESSFFCAPAEVEKEIIEYAEVYVKNSGNKKKPKKTLVEDENGFKKYI